MIKIFMEKGSIVSLKEANMFLESAGQGYLTDSEVSLHGLKPLASGLFPKAKPRTVPLSGTGTGVKTLLNKSLP